MNSTPRVACIILAIIVCALLAQNAEVQAAESLQGALIYVKGGNLWSHDLATGKEKKLTTDGTCDAPQVSPSGRLIAYTSTRDKYRNVTNKNFFNEQIYILDRSTGKSRKLIDRPGSVLREPVWTPDGKAIACARINYGEIVKKAEGFNEYRTEIDIIDISTAKVTVLAKGVLGYEWHDCSSPMVIDGGKMLIYFYSEPGIRDPRILTYPGGKKIELKTILKDLSESDEFFFPAFSPDGKFIALTGIRDTSIRLMDRASGTVKKIDLPDEELTGSLIMHSFSPDSRNILCSFPLGEQSSKIFIFNLDGTLVKELTGGKSPCWDNQKN